jgi:hypothetical protein
MDTLKAQNKAESNTNVAENEPIDRLMQISPQQQPVPSARQFFTYETLYVWGFRFIVLAIVASFVFVAAIYYGVINP